MVLPIYLNFLHHHFGGVKEKGYKYGIREIFAGQTNTKTICS
jgi:hypothetical protein